MKRQNKVNDILFTAAAVIAPTYAMRVLQARMLKRAYEGAEDYPSSDWSPTTGSSANTEIDRAQKRLISRSRDLVRNNPYTKKASDVVVSNVIGHGIVPKISGPKKTSVKKLQKLWKEVAESTLCDNERRSDFYTLQALAMQTIFESGEVLAIKYLSPEAPSIQLLEPDFIDSSSTLLNKEGENRIVSGIELDKNNRRIAYNLFLSHPGDMGYSSAKSERFTADKIIHSYNQTRPGQIRGIPWSHAVMQTLKDFADYQYATIVRQKIAACMVGVITKNGSDNMLPPDKLKEKRKKETMMTPGSWRYLDQGESATFSTPPPVQGYGEFVRMTISSIAAGIGITYESISNDYGNVNFSSGRMGFMEMKRNIEKWRWNMIVPQFCDPYMKHFLEWAKMKGYDVEGIEVEWVTPAHVQIDPTKEINADKEAVKAGFKSKSQVIREQGLDPESVREEIAAERAADEKAGLNFDVYTEPKPEQNSEGKNNEINNENTENNEEKEEESDKNPQETD